MRDAMRERIGLAGTGAGNDQQRRAGRGTFTAMRDGAALLGIEIVEISRSVCQHESPLETAESAISLASAMRWACDGMQDGVGFPAVPVFIAVELVNATRAYRSVFMIRNRSFLSRLPTERARSACASAPALLSNQARHESRKSSRAEFFVHHRR